jgi:hypothetical protein
MIDWSNVLQIGFWHIPRRENELADSLAKKQLHSVRRLL